MTKMLIRTIKQHGRPIWRCGRRFDREGQVVAKGDLTEDELTRIEADPALEIVAPDEATGGHNDELRQRVADAIRGLAPEGFTARGVPDVKALRSALPRDEDKITASLRDEVWDALTAQGFETPHVAAD
ncbi:MAG: hypothetical protein QNJ16_19940 [Rhodobacter sp.]|nr:hypothetical protein [Rhodobacter sp.]